MRIAILKTQAKSKILSPNIDLEITQQVAPSIFSLRENISKPLIIQNSKIGDDKFGNIYDFNKRNC